MKLFGWFRKNRFDLDHDGKIESFAQEIEGLFANVVKAVDKIKTVNDGLTKVIDSAQLDSHVIQEELDKHVAAEQAKIAQNEKVVEKAQAQIQANEGLQQTLQQFIPKQ